MLIMLDLGGCHAGDLSLISCSLGFAGRKKDGKRVWCNSFFSIVIYIGNCRMYVCIMYCHVTQNPIF